jgi:hypothetical protein
MKNFLYNILVFLGKLFVAFVFLFMTAFIIPVWILLEVVTYIEKVTKTRSNRVSKECID